MSRWTYFIRIWRSAEGYTRNYSRSACTAVNHFVLPTCNTWFRLWMPRQWKPAGELYSDCIHNYFTALSEGKYLFWDKNSGQGSCYAARQSPWKWPTKTGVVATRHPQNVPHSYAWQPASASHRVHDVTGSVLLMVVILVVCDINTDRYTDFPFNQVIHLFQLR